ncbi:glycerol uptake operon antiterminator [Clostridium cavendishii DSM 21758]|uniref:Glycerol uptake operon antiterminator n=1 Tax=Clostridium cavendishii DSM 21758 TaxID=1121302 RepID=A0A1M6PPQ0_9CLOT|nr:glycerol-3-phosphate responsive antiterminator [Clostridium cavendishii]SHK09984.1 glycerol uptake operon antiterminator [Clostridium cavendishii DSM 21758]
MRNFKELLEENPVIAAVKDMNGLNKALESDVQVIFVLFGNIINISEISKKIYDNKKVGIIHIDLVDGLASREIAIEFLKNNTKFHGIISTKPQVIKAAKNYGFIAIQRSFILDTISLINVKNHLVESCDAVEILPGLLFKVMNKLSKTINKPLIAGGLISDKEDVVEALRSGATCISTTREEIWDM